MPDENKTDNTALTADVVSAYVSHNAVRTADLPELISSVHGALKALRVEPTEPEKLEPPVPIKRTITPDFLISLEDGRRYKSLKRHLRGRGLTPEQYRAKWGLASDYPMVAPNYAKQRSELAKSLGLGQLRRRWPVAADPVAVAAPETAPEPNPHARRRRKQSAEAA